MTASPERLEGTVDPKLLEILVCPLTKGPLEFDATRQELISRSAKLAYPIRDGIPIMLPEEARNIDGGALCSGGVPANAGTPPPRPIVSAVKADVLITNALDYGSPRSRGQR